MKLNGWQRLWVFLSAPLGICGLLALVIGLVNQNWVDIKAGLTMAVVIPVLMYVFGFGIAWIRRGFGE